MSKRLKIFFSLVVISVVAVYFYKKYRIAPDFPLSKIELIRIDGSKTTIDSYKGNSIIVSFYASWCGDCIKEFNELKEVYKDDLKKIKVICITDDPIEKIISFQEKRNYPFEFYHINKSFHDLKMNTIPVTYLLNADGTVVYNKVGAVKWKDESFRQFALTRLTDHR